MNAPDTAAYYDEAPYLSKPFPETHPDRLAVMAALAGLDPAPVEHCRVLELGCATGGNLLPMAAHLPGSRFVGIDASRVQIDAGLEIVRTLGLDNAELHAMDILDVGDELGRFDYVIAHGVYSWVPEPVRRRILDICARQLAPQGVAYISYNTYPGWHAREQVRDMLRFHTRKFSTVQERMHQMQAFMDFLERSIDMEKSAYGVVLKDQLGHVRRSPDYYTLHEYLEPDNQPFYYHEFVHQAAQSGLHCIGDSLPHLTTLRTLPPHVAAAVRALSDDPVEQQQYLDFLSNRTFRRTLLARVPAHGDPDMAREAVRHMHIVSYAQPVVAQPDIRDPAESVVFRRENLQFAARHPVTKAALMALTECAPHTLPFARLLNQARARLALSGRAPAPAADEERVLADDLLEAHDLGVVELHAYQAVPQTPAGDRPCASAMARHQATRQGWVTGRRHIGITLSQDEFAFRLLPLLEGTRDRAALEDRMVEYATSGAMPLMHEGAPVTDREKIRAAVRASLARALENFAKLGLLLDGEGARGGERLS